MVCYLILNLEVVFHWKSSSFLGFENMVLLSKLKFKV